MLENTFCHIPGISVATERLIWEAGVHCWDDFPAVSGALQLLPARGKAVAGELAQSRRHLEKKNPAYFSALLPAKEQWRLYPVFRDAVAYLDIETTGLSRERSHITTIALYDGRNIRHYVRGENLEAFAVDIQEYRLLVTYNGKAFDLPFIERELGVPLRQAHIDLMHVLRGLGFRGGLKGCEKQAGLSRGELEGVDGRLAVHLWDEYRKSGDRRALETLLAYNIEDVVNLAHLMVMAYNLKLVETPFAASHSLPLPERPSLPFRADPATIRRLCPYFPFNSDR
jgi:uncharacterized protein YprB with RNaseH-like and TPR domain